MPESVISYHFDPAHRQILALNESGDQIGEITYHAHVGFWGVNHTGVRPEYRGGSIALDLIASLVAEARRAGVKLGATCPYAVKVMHRTAEYQDIYSAD